MCALAVRRSDSCAALCLLDGQGNGEMGVVIGGTPADNNLTFFLGSNQFWSAPTSGISQCGFRDGDNLYFALGGGGGVRQIGGVTITAPGFVNAARAGKPEQYRAGQRIIVFNICLNAF